MRSEIGWSVRLANLLLSLGLRIGALELGLRLFWVKQLTLLRRQLAHVEPSPHHGP